MSDSDSIDASNSSPDKSSEPAEQPAAPGSIKHLKRPLRLGEVYSRDELLASVGVGDEALKKWLAFGLKPFEVSGAKRSRQMFLFDEVLAVWTKIREQKAEKSAGKSTGGKR